MAASGPPLGEDDIELSFFQSFEKLRAQPGVQRQAEARMLTLEERQDAGEVADEVILDDAELQDALPRRLIEMPADLLGQPQHGGRVDQEAAAGLREFDRTGGPHEEGVPQLGFEPADPLTDR